MRVLQILGSLTYGGAETMVINYFRHIDKHECHMDFVVHGVGNGVYEEEVKKRGSKVIHLPTAGSIGFWKYVMELRKVIIDNGPYDVVHAHTNIQEGMALFAAKLAGVPIRVSHSHNTSFNASPIKLHINRALLMYFSNRKLACGEAAGIAFYGKRNFRIINNAVEIKSLAKATEMAGEKKRLEFGLDKKSIVLGHVGRFVEQKNHYFLLDAFAEAVKVRPELRLVCVGEGNLLPNIKQLAKDFDIEDKVLFIGSQSNMPIIYRMFDAFVLPSRHEGLPLTLVEAQAANLKCIVADTITRECDFGLGSVSYIPLDKEMWSRELGKVTAKEKNVDESMLICAGSRYDIEIQCEELLRVYR